MRRMLIASLPFFFSLSFSIGCDKPAPEGSTEKAEPSAAAPTPPPPTAEAPAPAPPDELDTAALQKALGCGGQAGTGPCRVLSKLGACTAWNPIVPSGDGRWLGRGYVIDSGKTSEQVTLLRARRVPLNEVGPGQLPVKIGIAELSEDEGLAHKEAARTIRIFERKDTPPRSNATVDHLKKRADWPEAFAMRTSGKQVYAIAQAGTYLCEGPEHQLLVVQRAATRKSNTDGLYAELWAATW